ncbi:hypothetical protein Droror1_Dr00012738 [Drosera rotundifolia]
MFQLQIFKNQRMKHFSNASKTFSCPCMQIKPRRFSSFLTVCSDFKTNSLHSNSPRNTAHSQTSSTPRTAHRRTTTPTNPHELQNTNNSSQRTTPRLEQSHNFEPFQESNQLRVIIQTP